MPGDDGFESPLDDLFVEGATVHELSAAERAAHARKRRARDKRAKKDARRAQRKGRVRPILIVAGFLALALVAYKVFPADSSSNTASAKLPKHITVYYALPQGVVADPKMPDAIRHDISVVQGWLSSQTNGRVLRFDERDSVIDVETRQLTNAVPVLANQDDAPVLVNEQFAPQDGGTPDAISLVFVPVVRNTVGRTTDCGVATGATAIIWVGSCGYQESINSAWPSGETKVIAHELLHAMGAVPPCAPHYGSNGHTVDNVNDIMYPNAERGPAPVIELDPGHDDYYDTHIKNCFDVADHPAWTHT